MTKALQDDALPDGPVVWDCVVDPDTQEKFAIVLDENSQTYFTSPVPIDLDRYYTASYHGNRHGFTAAYCDRRRANIMRRALKQFRRIRGGRTASRKQQEPIQWLDVGCGDGTLLELVSRSGWTAVGVERFPEAARNRGLVVFSSLEEAAASGPYDGVSLWHVLEHLKNPGNELDTIHSLLRPEGVLLVAVPDAGCASARWFGPHWLHWDVPRHVFHFTAPSLKCLLERHNFQAVHLPVSEFEYDLMGFSQSVLNRMGMPQNMFFKLLTKRPVAQSRWMRFMNLAMGACLCGGAAIPVWISGRFGKAGTLVFQATKHAGQGGSNV